jgi:hypothetical protein
MPPYHPPQRVLPARILTASGWLRARLHVPRLHALSDYLGHPSPYLPLTNVVLPGSLHEAPFLALRRSAALVVLPACDERRLLLARPPEGAVGHQVTCVFSAGAVCGRMDLPPHTRVSDFLAHHLGFILLREADVGPARTRVPLLFVNASAILAVAETPPPLPRRVGAPPALVGPCQGPIGTGVTDGPAVLPAYS